MKNKEITEEFLFASNFAKNSERQVYIREFFPKDPDPKLTYHLALAFKFQLVAIWAMVGNEIVYNIPLTRSENNFTTKHLKQIWLGLTGLKLHQFEKRLNDSPIDKSIEFFQHKGYKWSKNFHHFFKNIEHTNLNSVKQEFEIRVLDNSMAEIYSLTEHRAELIFTIHPIEVPLSLHVTEYAEEKLNEYINSLFSNEPFIKNGYAHNKQFNVYEKRVTGIEGTNDEYAIKLNNVTAIVDLVLPDMTKKNIIAIRNFNQEHNLGHLTYYVEKELQEYARKNVLLKSGFKLNDNKNYYSKEYEAQVSELEDSKFEIQINNKTAKIIQHKGDKHVVIFFNDIKDIEKNIPMTRLIALLETELNAFIEELKIVNIPTHEEVVTITEKHMNLIRTIEFNNVKTEYERQGYIYDEVHNNFKKYLHIKDLMPFDMYFEIHLDNTGAFLIYQQDNDTKQLGTPIHVETKCNNVLNAPYEIDAFLSKYLAIPLIPGYDKMGYIFNFDTRVYSKENIFLNTICIVKIDELLHIQIIRKRENVERVFNKETGDSLSNPEDVFIYAEKLLKHHVRNELLKSHNYEYRKDSDKHVKKLTYKGENNLNLTFQIQMSNNDDVDCILIEVDNVPKKVFHIPTKSYSNIELWIEYVENNIRQFVMANYIIPLFPNKKS